MDWFEYSYFKQWRIDMYHSRRDFLKSMTCTVPAFFIFPGMLRDDQVQASSNYPFIPVDAPNTPMGQGRGIFPGRVIWTYDPNAAVWIVNSEPVGGTIRQQIWQL